MYVSKIILEKIRQRFTLYHTEYRREKSALKAQARTDSVVPRHRGVDVAHRHKQDKVGDVQLCPGPPPWPIPSPEDLSSEAPDLVEDALFHRRAIRSHIPTPRFSPYPSKAQRNYASSLAFSSERASEATATLQPVQLRAGQDPRGHQSSPSGSPTARTAID